MVAEYILCLIGMVGTHRVGSQEYLKKMLCLYSRHESSYGFGRIMCHASGNLVRAVHHVELLSPSPAAILGAVWPIGQHPEDSRVDGPSLGMVCCHGNGAWNPSSRDYTACWTDTQGMPWPAEVIRLLMEPSWRKTNGGFMLRGEVRDMADLPNTPPCEGKHADALTLGQHQVAMESTQARKIEDRPSHV